MLNLMRGLETITARDARLDNDELIEKALILQKPS